MFKLVQHTLLSVLYKDNENIWMNHCDKHKNKMHYNTNSLEIK